MVLLITVRNLGGKAGAGFRKKDNENIFKNLHGFILS